MIDLHCHVLPGIDDGAGDWGESVEMCRMAAADGCDMLVATPHQRKAWPTEDPERLGALVDELQERIGSEPRVHLGGEIHVDSEILDELEQPGLGGLAPLAGSRALLIEFGHSPPSIGAAGLVHELILSGWTPVLAHPEFIPFLADDLDLLAELVHMGSRSQVTAMSVTGEFGRSVQRSVHAMLDRGLVHFLASDAHSTTWRPPGLSGARGIVADRWGRAVADRLTVDNPLALIEGQNVPIDSLARSEPAV